MLTGSYLKRVINKHEIYIYIIISICVCNFTQTFACMSVVFYIWNLTLFTWIHFVIYLGRQTFIPAIKFLSVFKMSFIFVPRSTFHFFGKLIICRNYGRVDQILFCAKRFWFRSRFGTPDSIYFPRAMLNNVLALKLLQRKLFDSRLWDVCVLLYVCVYVCDFSYAYLCRVCF